MDPSDVALREQLEVELVALIEEWHTLRASDFEETNSGAYGVLKEKTSEFIRTVFGDTECQRFESNGDAETRTWNDNVDLRIRALECLRDRSDEWHIRVDAKGLKVAIAARKHLDYGGQLAIGTSPLAKNYEAALSSPNAGAFPGQNPQDDSLAALEKLYTEGDAMLRSAHPFSQITGTAPNSRPTDADIEDWKRRVLAQLPAHYRGRFKVASLRAPGPFAAITAHLSLESEQVRRLRPHVLELEEIIGAMSYP